MPSGLKRYHGEGSDHFIPFSCFSRLPYLDNDPARIVFEQGLEQVRKKHYIHAEGYPAGEMKHGPNIGCSIHAQHLGHEWAAPTARTHLRAKTPPCQAV